MSGSPEKKTQGILEILAALSARGLTGRLRVDTDAVAGQSIEFLFRDGHLLFATSNRPGERWGVPDPQRNPLSNNAKHALLEAQLQGRFFHSYLVDGGDPSSGSNSGITLPESRGIAGHHPQRRGRARDSRAHGRGGLRLGGSDCRCGAVRPPAAPP